jgi:CBS domain-containing protein
MNVKDLMSREVRSVRMTDRLDAAARVMWEQDCGLCPVVDSSNVLVGVVTDRDLCMASYTQGKALLELPVTAVMARGLRTCKPDDAVTTALTTLQQAQLHRLPVVDARGVLVGVLSISDLVRTAQARPTAFDATAVLKAMAQICAPRRAAATATAAAPIGPAAAAKPATAIAAANPPAGKMSTPGAVTFANPAPVKPAAPMPAPVAAKPVTSTKPANLAKPGKQKGKGKKG